MDCNVFRRTISETGINSVIKNAVHDVESAIQNGVDINLEQSVKINNSLMLSLATTNILKHIDSGSLQDVRKVLSSLFLDNASDEYNIAIGLQAIDMASEEQVDFVNKVDESAWSFADIIIAKVKNFTSIGGGSILSKTLDDAKVLVFSDSHGNVDRRAVLRTLEQVKQIVLSALIDRSKPYATLREGDVSSYIKRGLEEFLAAESSGNGGVNTFSVNDGDLRFYLSENIDRITDPTTPVGWRGAMFAAVMFDKILADEGMLQNTIAVDARKINLVQFENKYSTIRTRLSSYLQGVDEDESGTDISEYMPAIINLDISRFKTAYGKPLKIANLVNAFNKVKQNHRYSDHYDESKGRPDDPWGDSWNPIGGYGREPKNDIELLVEILSSKSNHAPSVRTVSITDADINMLNEGWKYLLSLINISKEDAMDPKKVLQFLLENPSEGSSLFTEFLNAMMMRTVRQNNIEAVKTSDGVTMRVADKYSLANELNEIKASQQRKVGAISQGNLNDIENSFGVGDRVASKARMEDASVVVDFPISQELDLKLELPINRHKTPIKNALRSWISHAIETGDGLVFDKLVNFINTFCYLEISKDVAKFGREVGNIDASKIGDQLIVANERDPEFYHSGQITILVERLIPFFELAVNGYMLRKAKVEGDIWSEVLNRMANASSGRSQGVYHGDDIFYFVEDNYAFHIYKDLAMMLDGIKEGSYRSQVKLQGTDSTVATGKGINIHQDINTMIARSESINLVNGKKNHAGIFSSNTTNPIQLVPCNIKTFKVGDQVVKLKDVNEVEMEKILKDVFFSEIDYPDNVRTYVSPDNEYGFATFFPIVTADKAPDSFYKVDLTRLELSEGSYYDAYRNLNNHYKYESAEGRALILEDIASMASNVIESRKNFLQSSKDSFVALYKNILNELNTDGNRIIVNNISSKQIVEKLLRRQVREIDSIRDVVSVENVFASMGISLTDVINAFSDKTLGEVAYLHYDKRGVNLGLITKIIAYDILYHASRRRPKEFFDSQIFKDFLLNEVFDGDDQRKAIIGDWKNPKTGFLSIGREDLMNIFFRLTDAYLSENVLYPIVNDAFCYEIKTKPFYKTRKEAYEITSELLQVDFKKPRNSVNLNILPKETIEKFFEAESDANTMRVKRMVAFTTTTATVNINSSPFTRDHIKAAVLKDLTASASTFHGETIGKHKVNDGAMFVSGLSAGLWNKLSAYYNAGSSHVKDFGLFMTEQGFPLEAKTASFLIQNHKLRQSNNNEVSYEGVFKKMLSANPISSNSIGILFDYMSEAIADGSIEKYWFRNPEEISFYKTGESFVRNGSIERVDRSYLERTKNRLIKISTSGQPVTLYDVFLSIGGKYSSTSKGDYNNASIDLIVEGIAKLGIASFKERGGFYADRNTPLTIAFDEIQEGFIDIAANESAIKVGATNTTRFDEPWKINKLKPLIYGPQGSFDHSAEAMDGKIASQVVSAAVQSPVTEDIAVNIYEGFKSLIEQYIDTYFKVGDDVSARTKVLDRFMDDFVINGTPEDRAYFKAVMKNMEGNGDFAPISFSSVRDRLYSKVASKINKEAVRLEFNSNANVLHPSHGLVKVYNIPAFGRDGQFVTTKHLPHNALIEHFQEESIEGLSAIADVKFLEEGGTLSIDKYLSILQKKMPELKILKREVAGPDGKEVIAIVPAANVGEKYHISYQTSLTHDQRFEEFEINSYDDFLEFNSKIVSLLNDSVVDPDTLKVQESVQAYDLRPTRVSLRTDLIDDVENISGYWITEIFESFRVTEMISDLYKVLDDEALRSKAISSIRGTIHGDSRSIYTDEYVAILEKAIEYAENGNVNGYSVLESDLQDDVNAVVQDAMKRMHNGEETHLDYVANFFDNDSTNQFGSYIKDGLQKLTGFKAQVHNPECMVANPYTELFRASKEDSLEKMAKSGYFYNSAIKDLNKTSSEFVAFLAANSDPGVVMLSSTSGEKKLYVHTLETVETIDKNRYALMDYKMIEEYGKNYYNVGSIKINPEHFAICQGPLNEIYVVPYASTSTKDKKSLITKNELPYVFRSVKDVPGVNGGNNVSENQFGEGRGFSYIDVSQRFDRVRENELSGHVSNRADVLKFVENSVKHYEESFREFQNVFTNRIPAQSYQSMMLMRNIGFTGDSTASMYVSRVKTIFEGSDYDIDKVYSMYPSLSKKGELYKWTPFFSTKRKVLSEIVKFPPVNPNFKTIRFGNGSVEEGSVIESAYRSIYDALREIAKILDLDEENTAASRLENKAEFLAVRRDGSDISATKDQRVAQLTSLLAKVLAMRNTQITDYQVTIAKAINNILRIHGDKDYSVYSEDALDDMAMDRALGFVQEDGGKATDITLGVHKNDGSALYKAIVESHHGFHSGDFDYLREGSKNRILYSLNAIISHPANLIYAQESVGYARTEAIIEKLGLSGNNKSFPNSVEQKAYLVGVNNIGKRSIGTSATGQKVAFATLQAIVQSVNADKSSDSKEEKERKAISRMFNIDGLKDLLNRKGVRLYGNDINDGFVFVYQKPNGEKETKRFNIEMSRERLTKVVSVISELITLSTDNAKEGKLSLINATPQTLDMYIAGLILGVNYESLIALMTSKEGLAFGEYFSGDIYKDKFRKTDPVRVFADFKKKYYSSLYNESAYDRKDAEDRLNLIDVLTRVSKEVMFLGRVLGVTTGLDTRMEKSVGLSKNVYKHFSENSSWGLLSRKSYREDTNQFFLNPIDHNGRTFRQKLAASYNLASTGASGWTGVNPFAIIEALPHIGSYLRMGGLINEEYSRSAFGRVLDIVHTSALEAKDDGVDIPGVNYKVHRTVDTSKAIENTGLFVDELMSLMFFANDPDFETKNQFFLGKSPRKMRITYATAGMFKSFVEGVFLTELKRYLRDRGIDNKFAKRIDVGKRYHKATKSWAYTIDLFDNMYNADFSQDINLAEIVDAYRKISHYKANAIIPGFSSNDDLTVDDVFKIYTVIVDKSAKNRTGLRGMFDYINTISVVSPSDILVRFGAFIGEVDSLFNNNNSSSDWKILNMLNKAITVSSSGSQDSREKLTNALKSLYESSVYNLRWKPAFFKQYSDSLFGEYKLIDALSERDKRYSADEWEYMEESGNYRHEVIRNVVNVYGYNSITDLIENLTYTVGRIYPVADNAGYTKFRKLAEVANDSGISTPQSIDFYEDDNGNLKQNSISMAEVLNGEGSEEYQNLQTIDVEEMFRALKWASSNIKLSVFSKDNLLNWLRSGANLTINQVNSFFTGHNRPSSVVEAKANMTSLRMVSNALAMMRTKYDSYMDIFVLDSSANIFVVDESNDDDPRVLINLPALISSKLTQKSLYSILSYADTFKKLSKDDRVKLLEYYKDSTGDAEISYMTINSDKVFRFNPLPFLGSQLQEPIMTNARLSLVEEGVFVNERAVDGGYEIRVFDQSTNKGAEFIVGEDKTLASAKIFSNPDINDGVLLSYNDIVSDRSINISEADLQKLLSSRLNISSSIEFLKKDVLTKSLVSAVSTFTDRDKRINPIYFSTEC